MPKKNWLIVLLTLFFSCYEDILLYWSAMPAFGRTVAMQPAL